MAGLPDSATEELLRDLFAESGLTVEEVSLPRDRMTGRPRGFAFLRLAGPDEVTRALAELHGRILGESSISVRRFNAEPPPRGERPAGGGFGGPPRGPAVDTSDRTLFVGNLPYDTTPEELDAVLRGAGADQIARIHLPMDPEGRRRGFGFVTLASAEAARAAVEVLRGVALRNRALVVNIALPKAAPGTGAPREPRPFGGPPGAAPGAAAGAPGANRFGPDARPGGKPGYAAKRKKTEGSDGPGRGGRAAKRPDEERWRNDDE
ncbi:MAG: hypothetical protein HY909_24415 [Deltaproteobacteria bacterium]|nr:hypothetical protein [Deltaproteobacteria bacterium]